MKDMLVALAVFQLEMSWLNADASENVSAKFPTKLVFHLPMFWLNADAPLNMPPIRVTAAVFQCPIFLLKLLAEEKIEVMQT